MAALLGFVLLSFVAAVTTNAWRQCSVLDFNATGDGKSYDTEAIARAIAACAGGGTVVLPAGKTYLTGGGHVLGSNMALEVQKGAVLRLTNDTKHLMTNWSVIAANVSQGVAYTFSTFLSSANASNVSFYGQGTVDGGGEWCWSWANRPHGSPNIMFFESIHGLMISGLTVKNPCGWTIHPHNVDNLHIHDISILCEPVQYHYNTDGIDPDSCTNVLIEDVHYACGDDAVAVKASHPGCKPSKNVTVRRLYSGGRGGLTVGSEIQGGVEDTTFEDSVSTGASGIRVSQQNQQGGYIRNLVFKNISFSWGDKWAFQKKSFMFGIGQSYPAPVGSPTRCPGMPAQPVAHGVHYENLTVIKAPPGLRIGSLSCDPDAGGVESCTNFSVRGIKLLDAPKPLPLTCANVHGTIIDFSPADASKCVMLNGTAAARPHANI